MKQVKGIKSNNSKGTNKNWIIAINSVVTCVFPPSSHFETTVIRTSVFVATFLFFIVWHMFASFVTCV